MRRKNTKISRPRKNTYAIVVDGETEVWYFQMLKRNEPSLLVNIEPKIPQKKKLSDQFKKVCCLSKDYTKVFWIIDLDVIIAESNKSELKKYLKELEKEEFKDVVTIFNNPCLEFWFVLHFEQTTKYYPKCKEVEKKLVKQLKNYKKTQKYFTKLDNDIYLKLKPRLSTALKNTKRTQKGNIEEIERGICEMNLFFDTEQIKKILV